MDSDSDPRTKILHYLLQSVTVPYLHMSLDYSVISDSSPGHATMLWFPVS